MSKNTVIKGACLCGRVRFSITGALPNIYQCHCSLCRKVTGAAANAATLINVGDFQWHSETEKKHITSFTKPTGYRADFCKNCGSPVPNVIANSELVWIPVGLIDTPVEAKVVQHLHLDSKATWDNQHAISNNEISSPNDLHIVLTTTVNHK